MGFDVCHTSMGSETASHSCRLVLMAYVELLFCKCFRGCSFVKYFSNLAVVFLPHDSNY